MDTQFIRLFSPQCNFIGGTGNKLKKNDERHVSWHGGTAPISHLGDPRSLGCAPALPLSGDLTSRHLTLEVC